MVNLQSFNEGVEYGARGVIDLLETRLYYMPETWRQGDGAYIIDIIEKTLETAKRIYLGGGYYGEES